ncbi:tetratricopeptide repeat-containing sensor histidine kinase [Shiella aurantiaca]|nr:HAMP domain-containing sensor histidine kinase [Shiella aurantiaca]
MKIKKAIFFTLCVLHLSAQGQTTYLGVDSLSHLLSQATSDSQRVHYTYLLSKELVYVDPAKALTLANQGEQLAQKINNRLALAYIYRIKASIFAAQGLYSAAAEVGAKAEIMFLDLGDKAGLANYQISLGHLFRRQGLFERSLAYHFQSYQYFLANGPLERICVSMHNYAEALYYVDSLDKAEKINLKAIQLNDSIRNKSVLMSCFKAQGLIAQKLGKTKEAQYYFDQCIQLGNEMGKDAQKDAALNSMLALADIYQQEGKFDLQLSTLKDAEEYALKYSSDQFLVDIYLQMFQFFVQKNNLEQANIFLSEYKEQLQSNRTKLSAENENFIDALYESIVLTNQNELLKQKTQLDEVTIKNQKTQLLFAIALIITLILSAYVILINVRKLKKANRLLKIQKLAIEKTSQELEELNAVKDKFFGIVSHDIRSPLASMLSFAALIDDHIDKLTQEEIRSMAHDLRNNANATLKMADNLISWARFQMKHVKTTPQAINPLNILHQLQDVFAHVAKEKNIQIRIHSETEEKILADANQTELVIRNLLNNALKFTASGGEIQLRVYSSENNVAIAIKDSGIGMTKEQVNDLFNLQTNKSLRGTNGEKGSGLGLIICKEYVENNKGSISVESKPGEGSTFTVFLPKA